MKRARTRRMVIALVVLAAVLACVHLASNRSLPLRGRQGVENVPPLPDLTPKGDNSILPSKLEDKLGLNPAQKRMVRTVEKATEKMASHLVETEEGRDAIRDMATKISKDLNQESVKEIIALYGPRRPDPPPSTNDPNKFDVNSLRIKEIIRRDDQYVTIIRDRYGNEMEMLPLGPHENDCNRVLYELQESAKKNPSLGMLLEFVLERAAQAAIREEEKKKQ